MTNEKKPYNAAATREVGIDIRVQMLELQRAARTTGSAQLEPGEIYISEKCYAALVDEYEFYFGYGPEPDHVFGLPIFQVPIKGYHVRVAPRLAMGPGVEFSGGGVES